MRENLDFMIESDRRLFVLSHYPTPLGPGEGGEYSSTRHPRGQPPLLLGLSSFASCRSRVLVGTTTTLKVYLSVQRACLDPLSVLY